MTLDELDALLGETEQVEAGGHVWDVADPTQAEALAVQRAFVAMAGMDGGAQDGAPDDATPEDGIARAEAADAMVLLAVRACVRVDGADRLDERRAGVVVRKTGRPGRYDENPLALACLRRCGVDLGGEDAQADPT